MSTLTVTEVMIQLLDHLPDSAAMFEQQMRAHGVELMSVETAHALIAASARLRFPPLNLGIASFTRWPRLKAQRF